MFIYENNKRYIPKKWNRKCASNNILGEQRNNDHQPIKQKWRIFISGLVAIACHILLPDYTAAHLNILLLISSLEVARVHTVLRSWNERWLLVEQVIPVDALEQLVLLQVMQSQAFLRICA